MQLSQAPAFRLALRFPPLSAILEMKAYYYGKVLLR